MSYFIQGQNYPAYSLDELSSQLPSIKKKYTDYKSYSETKTQDLLTLLNDKESFTTQIHELASGILLNNNGELSFTKLPIQAQFSMVNAIKLKDMNGDKLPDLILAGNNSKMRVRIGHLDANHGQLFINKGKGNFEYLPQNISGLNIRGDVKNMAFVGDKILFGVNNAPLMMYQKAYQ